MKKLRRLTAMFLSLALALSLAAAPAGAVNLTDISTHWAKSDIESLVNRGIISGYADGTFKPDGKMSAAEALMFCARATGLDSNLKAKISLDHQNELYLMLPNDMRSWAMTELAICLEVGIVSHDELSALCTSGAIGQVISRENVAMYLVRAMQLSSMADGLSNVSLPFADESSVAQNRRAYVYLLNTYGIVGGNDKNQFLPTSALSRAEMATLLKRALDFMDQRGMEIEIARYTTGDWVGGTVSSAVGGNSGTTVLTLNTEFSGTKTITLPSGTAIFENNLRTDASALRMGQYVRVNLDRKGSPESVRVSGALTTQTGTITGLTQSEIALTLEGVPTSYEIDRFTKVQVGKEVGDSALIDLSAGYTTASCKVDGLGHLAALQLTGGTRQMEGIIKSVELVGSGGTSLQIAGFNGETQRYTIPASAAVTVDGYTSAISSSCVESYISMRLSDDGVNQVSSANVDTKTKYIQGSIRNIRASNDTVTVNNFATGTSTNYELTSDAAIYYDGEESSLKKLSNGLYATVRLNGKKIDLLDAYPGSPTVRGVITKITYGTTTVLDVKLPDETVSTYNIDLSNPPAIYRGDKRTTIDKIKTGDEVLIETRYNKIERLEATAQNANMNGTITRITMETTGITLDLTLTDNSTASYPVKYGTSVTQNGKALALNDLKPGYKVGLVVSNDEVVSIEVSQTNGTGGGLAGNILYVDYDNWTLLLQWTDTTGESKVTNVDVNRATIVDATGGTIPFSYLDQGDYIQVYGSYSGQDYAATLIVRT